MDKIVQTLSNSLHICNQNGGQHPPQDFMITIGDNIIGVGGGYIYILLPVLSISENPTLVVSGVNVTS